MFLYPAFADIVSGCQMMDSLFVRQLAKQGPLQEVVAEGAGHRRVSCHVFADEVVDDGSSESLPLVTNQMGDAQSLAKVASVFQILRVIVLLVKTEGYTCHFISGIL